MSILENVDLKQYSTMRLGGQARYLAVATNKEDVKELVDWAKQKDLHFMMIGRGSNIVWKDKGYRGLVIVNELKGQEIIAQDEYTVVMKFAGGETWDDVVAQTVAKDLSGIEFLSAIPGTVGAAPVQNIGAYGAELSDVLVQLEAYNSEENEFTIFQNSECDFAYRTSRFKSANKGHYMITSITLRLSRSPAKPPFYESLQHYLDNHQITKYSPESIRRAVIAIRKIKLPDPSVVANNGSFFANPIIEDSQFQHLKALYPDIKAWPRKDGRVKISAGWMLEQAGFKGVHDHATGMATWNASALVIINERAKSTADLLAFKKKIVSKVHEMFSITLEQEPELLP